MKTLTLLSVLSIGVVLTGSPAVAQNRELPPRPDAPDAQATTPDATGRKADPSASPQTGGDTKPSAVDPAQSTQTGANASEGASYNRSSEKGDSTLPKEEADTKK
jgi:hypothetical protein